MIIYFHMKTFTTSETCECLKLNVLSNTLENDIYVSYSFSKESITITSECEHVKIMSFQTNACVVNVLQTR